MKSRYILPVLLLSSLFFSCKKYVEIKTQGSLVPGETINYRYLLNSTDAFEYGPQISDMASDDVQLVDGSEQQQYLNNSGYNYWNKSYTWQTGLYPLGETELQKDYNWNNMYGTIAYCNTIINEVPVSTGTEEEKAELIAEALVHRADAYLMLMNTYAQPYQPATANSDLGVPMVLIQTTSQSLARPSSQAVYDQIITDLKRALPALTTQAFTTIPSKASGYAELARCYLYMNNYASAAAYADSALAIKNTLNDLSIITQVNNTTYPLRKNDPEVLFSKVAYGGVSSYSPTALRLSDELLDLLGTKDQRYQLFTVSDEVIFYGATVAGGRFFYKDNLMYEARNIGPSVPEMMLIKAEYNARNNDGAGAMQLVNQLRRKRFKAEDYKDLIATSPENALKIVVEERRREFFCRMLRWWDMRRLQHEPQFQRTYTRNFDGATYTLVPGSNRYTFPIPPNQIQLNPEIQPNP